VRRFLMWPAMAALLLAACTPAADGSPAGTDAGDGAAAQWDITALMPNPSAVNVFNLCAAIGEGYMAEEGITVAFEAVDGSGAVLQAMVAGQAEIGLPGPGPLLNAHARGEEVVMFYNHFAQALFGLVVPEESDIQAPGDLGGGVVIGVGTAEGAEVSFARAILADAGLEEGTDYEFLPVGDGGPATAAFEREDIVAYAAAIPDMAIIRARGLPLREITPEQFLAFFGNGYAALQSTIDEDPELIAGFTRALLRGFEFAEANKDATLEHCAELNPEEGADTELTTALYDAVLPRAQPLGGLEVGLFAADAWQAWQDTLIESGELEEALDDLDAVWTNEFVEQAHQE
jgi:NitT/TauT family transport system substrate-binding protein